LAKMLLSGANLLLLDEPTNHLDIEATEWLEDFLKNYKGAFIVISHDRYFLDKITNRTFEIESNSLTAYSGNYTAFTIQKAEKRLTLQREYESTQKEIHRIEGIIEQQKRFNQERNYITIASKQKSIDRLKATLERPENDPDVINFQFHASRRGGNDVLMAEELALGFEGKQLFSHVNLYIRRQERSFLIGPNGCGKTSLLKILLDIYKEDCGEHRFGANIDIGYYDQAQGNLDDAKTVIDEIWDLHPQMTQTEVRSALAVFLFKGENVYKPVKGLSGGERARILLLKLMLSDTNFLILDEPTNHLDITSREALEDALMGYDGTLLVVSHDRYLINKLAKKVLYLSKDGITEYEGNYDAYLETRALETVTEEEEQPPKVNEYKLNKERKAEIRKMRSALVRCEERIEENENELEQVQQDMNQPEVASDYEKTIALSQHMDTLKAESEELLQTWEDLHLWLDKNDTENQDLEMER
ncbi:MAG: ATP-binding cassette domain-containing protein, partial [Oscillospiraceae bacterium]